MINVNQITGELAKMSDPMLQKYAELNKNDPYTVALAVGEANRRKAMRVGATPALGQMPKVVDQDIAEMAAPAPQIAQQLPEHIGIGQLPAPNMQRMADGGIVGYNGEEGSVTRLSGSQLFDKALDQEGITDPLRRAFAKAIHAQESSGKINARTSNRGAVGPMQVRGPAWKDVATPDMDPSNPFDNMRAGIRYAMKGFEASGGNPVLAGAHYYGGKGGMNKLIAGTEVSDPKNPNAPTTAGYGRAIADRMMQFLPVGSAEAAAVEKAVTTTPTAKAAPVAGSVQDIVSRIPTGGKPGAGPTPAVEKEVGFLSPEYMENKFGLSPDVARNVYNTMMAPTPLVPASTLPKTGGYLSKAYQGLAALGEKAYNKLVPSGKLSEEGIAALQAKRAEEAAANLAPRLTPPSAPLPQGGATIPVTQAGQGIVQSAEDLERIRLANQAADRAAAAGKVAQIPSEAEKIQTASLLREADEAQRLQNAAKTAANVKTNLASTQLPIGGISDLAPQKEAATTPTASEIDKTAIDAIKNKYTEENGKKDTDSSGFGGFFNNPMAMLGLQLMANKNPNLFGAFGEAGQGTAKYMSDLRKAEAEQGYYGAKGSEAKALADLYNRGAKDRNMQFEAEKLVQQHMEKWLAGPGKLASLQDKNAGATETSRIRQEIYQQLGLTPATMMAQQQVPSAAGWGPATVR